MQNPQGRRLAVIVNEFGDVGVDGEILKGYILTVQLKISASLPMAVFAAP